MTKERFEELVEIGAKTNAEAQFQSWDDMRPLPQTMCRSHARRIIAAVYPLIQDEVIDECVTAVSTACPEPSFENNTVTTVRNGFWFAIRAIRALKSKDTKL